MSIEQAFHQVCSNATPAKGVYVTLYHSEQWYGGPEEGGWYGTTTKVVAYQQFDTHEQADAAYDAVLELAEQLTTDARRAHNEQMRRECDWCEARGLDPADHPAGEPGGPDRYEVHVEAELGWHAHSSDPHYS